MGQEFHVVRCFSCQSFQVQQVKKVNKWTCKLCGQKQSLLKEFGRGSGADCRRHVQKLNAMRGAMLEEQGHTALSLWEAEAETDKEDEPEDQAKPPHTEAQVSTWSKYLDAPEEEEEPEEEDTVLMDRWQHQGVNMTDRKRMKRQGWTDKGRQSHGSALKRNPVHPSSTSRTTSLDETSLNHPTSRHCSLNQTDLTHTSLNQTGLTQTSLDQTSLDQTGLTQTSRTYDRLNQTSKPHASPPSKKSKNPPSADSGPGSRWACFLSSHSQVTTHRVEPPDSGWSQSVGRAAPQSGSDITHQDRPLSRPVPSLPVSSMFESGDDFNDELLTDDWL